MRIIQKIRSKISKKEYEFTLPHFFEEMANDNLQFRDIETAIMKGRVNRKLTYDPRGIRYEIVGPTTDGRQVAVICRIKNTGKLLLITTYIIG